MFLSFVSDLKGIRLYSFALQSPLRPLHMCTYNTGTYMGARTHTCSQGTYVHAHKNRHSIRFVGYLIPSMVPWLLQGDPSELLAQDRVTGGGVSGSPELPGLLPAGGWGTRASGGLIL